jgi:hypothetical protein
MAPRLVNVKSLRHFAFEALCEELITEFRIIFQKKVNNVTDVDDSQGPAAKVPRTDLIGDYVLTQAVRNKALDDLREKLDENLIGPYSEERHIIVNRFIKSHKIIKPSKVDYNLCLAFFNCLLDKSFTSLNPTGGEVNHPFDDFDPLELLPVISQQSPDLKFLSLYFGISSKEHTLVPALCTSFKSFKLLTSLNLASKWNTNTKKVDFIPFFASLGELCPKLIRLGPRGCRLFSQVNQLKFFRIFFRFFSDFSGFSGQNLYLLRYKN